MRKYLLYTMVAGLMSVLALTSCQKSADVTFPLPGTVWIGSPLYDLFTNRYYQGDVTHVLTIANGGTAKLLTVDNRTLRTAVTVTANKAVTWTLNGNQLDINTTGLGISGITSHTTAPSSVTLKGSLSYDNQNVNFMYKDTSYLAFDRIDIGASPLATKVFQGTFLKVGTTVATPCVWIFISDKGWKMVVPGYPVTIYPLSKYSVDNTGKVLVDFFGGTASSAVPIDYTNHKGTYTASNDSLVYNSVSVPVANVYPNSYNWRGVFRLKEVK